MNNREEFRVARTRRSEAGTHEWRVAVLAVALLLAGFLGAGCSAESKKARHLANARKYLQADQNAKAEVELMNVLRLDARNPEALQRLSLIYVAMGEMPRAYALLREARKVDTNSVEIRSKLAPYHLAAGRAKEAAEEVDFVLSRDPVNEDAVLLISDLASKPADLDAAAQRLQALQAKVGDKAIYRAALGQIAFKKGDLAKAEAEFRKAVELAPTHDAAYLGLANLALAGGKPDAAAAMFDKAYEFAPFRSNRKLRPVEYKVRTGKLEDAKKMLEDLKNKVPDYLPAAVYRARVQLAEKKYDDCSASLDGILARDPINYEGLLLRAELRLAKGDFDKAIKELELMLVRFPQSSQAYYHVGLANLLKQDMTKALSALKQTVTLDPGHVDATLLLADLNLRKGEAAAAVKSLVDLSKRRPNDTRVFASLAAAYRAAGRLEDSAATYRALIAAQTNEPRHPFMLGLVLRQQSKPAEARPLFERALQLAPNNTAALGQLVDLDLEAKDMATATRRMVGAIESDPKSANLRYMMARLLLAKRDIKGCEEALLKSLELDADQRQAHQMLAELYTAQKRIPEALDRLEKSLAKNPKDVVALLQMGMIYTAEKEFKKARQAYEQLLQVNPNHGPALNNLAYLYSDFLNDLDTAYEHAQKARKLMPNQPFSADTLGWILLRRGDIGLGLSLIQEAAEKMPQEPEVLYHLGSAFYMSGQEAPARDALQRALQLGREFVGREEVQRLLNYLTMDLRTDDPKALSELEKRLAEKPDDGVVLAKLGAYYDRKGDSAKVTKMYERAVKENPKAAGAVAKLAELYVDRAGQRDQALTFARNARTLAPEDTTVAHIAGRVAFKAGDHRWAQGVLQDAARRSPSDTGIAYDLALASYSLGRIADAEALLKQVNRDAGDPVRKETAGRLLGWIGLPNQPAQLAAAGAKIQEALKQDPKQVPALMAAGALYEGSRNAAAAIEVYRRALEQYPLFVPAMRQLAGLLADEPGREKEAYDYATKAREVFTNDPGLERLLGKLAYGRNDFNSAVQLLQSTVRRNAQDVEAMYYLGFSQMKAKQAPEGTKTLRRALELDGSHRLAVEAKKLLAAKP